MGKRKEKPFFSALFNLYIFLVHVIVSKHNLPMYCKKNPRVFCVLEERK